jgi:predicted nucleic acid-binding protein
MRKLIDTTFHVQFLTDESLVKPYLEAYDTPETEYLSSMVTMKELAVGVHHVEDDPSVADLHADFGWVDILPFSMRHAFYAGKIEQQFIEEGMPQEQRNALGGDVLLGGVALAEDATVVTQNTDEFELMPGVDVERY